MKKKVLTYKHKDYPVLFASNDMFILDWGTFIDEKFYTTNISFYRQPLELIFGKKQVRAFLKRHMADLI